VSGKTADLIAVRGNPLTHPETLRQVDVVIQSGGAIKMPDGLLD
jgi:imidazolonepropionase-like amidohydrolase